MRAYGKLVVIRLTVKLPQNLLSLGCAGWNLGGGSHLVKRLVSSTNGSRDVFGIKRSKPGEKFSWALSSKDNFTSPGDSLFTKQQSDSSDEGHGHEVAVSVRIE